MLKGEYNNQKRKKCRGHEVRKTSKRKKLDKAAFPNALEMAGNKNIIYTAKKFRIE